VIGPLLVAASRGADVRTAVHLALATCVAVASASLAFQMRTPADQLVPGPTLDSTVLLGVVLPVTVLARTLRDPSAWLVATSSRSVVVHRAVWITAVTAVAGLVSLLISWPMAPAQLPVLVFWDTMLLFGLSVVSTVLFGADLAWLVPGAVALLCSTPGVVPLHDNWLVLASRVADVRVVACVVVLGAGALFVWLDER
jgi:hypothetical protein